MTGFLLILALLQVTVPSPSSIPLKTIINVRSSPLCHTLVRNVLQSIQGLQANDGLARQGGMLLSKVRIDAIADPGGWESVDPVGGAGAPAAMDDVHLETLVHHLAQNLDRIDALLDDPARFPSDPRTADEQKLLSLKRRLQTVVAKQRVTLDILSGIAYSNASNDLQSQTQPGLPHAAYAAPVRTTAPEYLQLVQRQTQEAESSVAPAVTPLVSACR